jgi:hypothetical protein
MTALRIALITALAAFALAACQQDPISSGDQPEAQSTKENRSVMTAASPAISFTRTTAVRVHGTTYIYPTIAVMDADGSNATDIYTYSSLPASLKKPSWSPSGGSISFILFGNATGTQTILRRDVSIINGVPTGSNTQTVYQTAASDTTNIYGQAWSPSTTTSEIAFSTYRGGSVPVAQKLSRIYVISSSGGTPTALYTDYGHEFQYIAWSPDASQIAFTDHDMVADTSSIKIISRSTGTLQRTISVSLPPVGLDWSRSGSSKLAYATTNGSTSSTYTFDLSSGTSTYIAAGMNPAWSSDNTKIAYYPSTGSGIKSILLSTGAITTLSTTGNFPSWKR